VPTSKKPVWVSHKGEKHRVDTATGNTACGLKFKPPWPACNRTDPMCKTCTHGMRDARDIAGSSPGDIAQR